MYFDIYFKNNKKQNHIFSRLEISFVWNGDPNIQTIINYLYNKITHMEETYLLEPIENLNMVIISTEEKFLTDILKNKFPTHNTNDNKTFRCNDCAICLVTPPNVLYCNCGHQAICSTCYNNIPQDMNRNTCPICKKKNGTIRII